MNSEFNKTFGNYQLILSGSLIMIKENGDTIKAFDTNPLTSVDTFNKIADKLEAEFGDSYYVPSYDKVYESTKSTILKS